MRAVTRGREAVGDAIRSGNRAGGERSSSGTAKMPGNQMRNGCVERVPEL
jgi:hypothetical protein